MNKNQSKYVSCEEFLFRAINNKIFINSDNSIKVGAFLTRNAEPDECSVDRDGNRPFEVVCEFQRIRFKKYGYIGSCYISASFCKSIGVAPIMKPSRNNVFHSILVSNEEENILELEYADDVAESSTLIRINDSNY